MSYHCQNLICVSQGLPAFLERCNTLVVPFHFNECEAPCKKNVSPHILCIFRGDPALIHSFIDGNKRIVINGYRLIVLLGENVEFCKPCHEIGIGGIDLDAL